MTPTKSELFSGVGRGGEDNMQPRTNKVRETCQWIMFLDLGRLGQQHHNTGDAKGSSPISISLAIQLLHISFPKEEGFQINLKGKAGVSLLDLEGSTFFKVGHGPHLSVTFDLQRSNLSVGGISP